MKVIGYRVPTSRRQDQALHAHSKPEKFLF